MLRNRPSGPDARGTFERKRDAEAYAKDLVRRAGGGEAVLYTPSGSITGG